MKYYVGFIILLLFQWMNLGFCYDQDFDIPDDWIDPTDMENFDYHGQMAERPKRNEEADQMKEAKEFQEKDSDAKNNPKDIKNEKLEQPEVEESQMQDEQSCKYPFLRRFVSVLHKKLEYASGSSEAENFALSLHLGRKNSFTLSNFATDCEANIQEVTRILEDLVTDVHVRLDEGFVWKKRFEDFINMPFEEFLKLGVAIVIVVAILTLEQLSRVSWPSQLKRSVIVAFIISYVMTYIHELKLAEAEYKSKASASIPKECLGNDKDDGSMWESVKSVYQDMFSTKKDPCAEYHANFIITPAMKVTPMKVLAITLTRFAVEPMEHMGTAFSKAFKNIFADLPVTLWIPAFVFVIVVTVGFLLIVSVCFGYNLSLNLPFWAGVQLGPQQMLQHSPEMERVCDDYRRRIDQLEGVNRDLNSRLQQQALPAPSHPTASPSRARTILSYIGFGGGDNSPPGNPDPPPYPNPNPPGGDLPYPDFDAPQYPPEDQGPFTPRGYGDGRTARGPSELRRRHTVPGARKTLDHGSGDATTAYHPPRDARTRGSASESRDASQNPIGFEHLTKQQDESRTAPIAPRTEAPTPPRAPRMTGPAPVEEIPVQRSPRLPASTLSKVAEKVLPGSVTDEAPTLPVQDLETEDDSPDMEAWEEIPPNEGAPSHDESVGEKENTLEWQIMFEREAKEGFQSTE